MIPVKHFQYITIFSVLVMFINKLIFGDLSVDFVFLLGNFIVIVLFLSLLRYCQSVYLKMDGKKFIKKIFYFSFAIRVFAVLFYYLLFYYITGTEFDVEASDALWYDYVAKQTAASFRDGTFSSINFLIDIRGSFDDGGYIFILSLIYFLFSDSVILARIVQALLSALTVVLIYKIVGKVFDEHKAKLSAIIIATFQPLLLYASLHLKETFMVYFLLLFLHSGIKLVKEKVNLLTIVVLLASLIAMFSFRTVLGLIAMASFLGYLFLNSEYSYMRAAMLFVIIGVCVYFVAINFTILDDVVDKSKRYVGIETEATNSLGGTTASSFSDQGQSFGKYAGGGIFLLQSIVTPYPSMVKTNIMYYEQTLQWYYGGGLLIWAFLSYYAYIGLYYCIKENFKQGSIILFSLGIYTAALISSLYITSIRFNIIKMVLVIPFIAYGVAIAASSSKKNKHFVKYAVLMSIIVLIWNYIKIAGRGLQ